MLVSARLQVGDHDARGWVERLGWRAGVRVQTRDLPILTQEDVPDLLRKSGAPVDALASPSEFIRRLHELTEGEPLLLRLYIEDLWTRLSNTANRLALSDLDHIEPGCRGYFEDWLERQSEAWE